MYINHLGESWDSAGSWAVNRLLADVARARCKNNPEQFKLSKDIWKTLANRKLAEKNKKTFREIRVEVEEQKIITPSKINKIVGIKQKRFGSTRLKYVPPSEYYDGVKQKYIIKRKKNHEKVNWSNFHLATNER